MKHLAFLIAILVSFNASGQRFVDNTQYISNHAQARLREIEQHNRLLQRAVRQGKAKGNKDSHRIVVMDSTLYRSISLLNVLFKNFKDSTSHNVDTYNLDSVVVDTMVVDTLPWFKPFVRTRLPHGVD